MAVSREQFRGIGIEVYINKTISHVSPKRQRCITVRPDTFHFTTREPMQSFASACTIAVLQEENGRWGLFHGAFRRKDYMRNCGAYTEQDIADTKTLEDFLDTWNRTRNSPTEAAYLFATSSCVELARRRQEAIDLVRDRTDLSDNRLFISWNDYLEGETDVIVDPESRIIRISLNYCDSPPLYLPHVKSRSSAKI